MENSLNTIPEVCRLHLVNVGPWKDALFQFSSRINLIRGCGGCGKSFILRALLPTANAQLTSRIGSGDGTVTVEYARSEFRYELSSIPISDTDDSASPSVGQNIMRMIQHILPRAKSGSCICLEDELFGCLDADNCAQVVEMINTAKCQFIIVLPQPLKPEVFGSPRVFECRIDEETGSFVETIDLK